MPNASSELAERDQNKNPYRPAPASIRMTPSCFYLHYLDHYPDATSSPRFRIYYHDAGVALSVNAMRRRVEALARSIYEYGDAVHNGERFCDVPPAVGTQSKFAWRRKSYIVYLVNSDQWKLKNGDSIEIESYETGMNHTFLNADNWSIDLGEGARDRTAFACINYMQSKNGGDLDPGDREDFRFTFNWTGPAPFRGRDDGNTNLGPPVPPPA